jgi:uncharacterized SAM-binding protein YcdF (DUF218 family)
VTRKLLALLLVAWVLGFAWFAIFLPGPAEPSRTDAIVVLTGSPGRVARGLDLLKDGQAKRMLVSGVDSSVRRAEFDAAQNVPRRLSACCIDLEKNSVDTISNARETARWLNGHGYTSVRLVTTDWHMRRARLDLDRALGDGVRIVPDAVRSPPNLGQLFREYNKLIARYVATLFGG